MTHPWRMCDKSGVRGCSPKKGTVGGQGINDGFVDSSGTVVGSTSFFNFFVAGSVAGSATGLLVSSCPRTVVELTVKPTS